METIHRFLFTPGRWIGEGRITFSSSPEYLRFYTGWNVGKSTPPAVEWQQEVEMEGESESLVNSFSFTDITPTSFTIQLKNSLVGKVTGTGVIDPKTIAWEFRGQEHFEGFEVYELQDNGDYMLHAEYASPDQFRTIIDGRIWKKESGEDA